MNKKRIPPEIVCTIHGQKFVRFSYRNNQSYGCPQCVSELSERVRNERARMFGRKRNPPDVDFGSPEGQDILMQNWKNHAIVP